MGGDTKKHEEILRTAALAGAESSRAALSMFLEREIMLDDISVETAPLARLADIMGDEEAEIVAVLIELGGGLHGNIMLLLDSKSSCLLAEQLVGFCDADSADMDEMTSSSFAETGNIMLTSFLNGVSEKSGISLEPQQPFITGGPCGAVMDHIMITYDTISDECVLIKTIYSDSGHSLCAYVLFLPYPETTEVLAESEMRNG
ncbi:MAG: chemotaxis protein CheC [bacterium]